jgi:hypothetical protein
LAPTFPNLGAVDSMIQPDKMFHITVAPSHPVKIPSLMKVINVTRTYKTSSNKAEKLSLCFVVPADLYESYTHVQPYVKESGDEYKINTADFLICTQIVDQYVRCVELYATGAGASARSALSPSKVGQKRQASPSLIARTPVKSKPSSEDVEMTTKVSSAALETSERAITRRTSTRKPTATKK